MTRSDRERLADRFNAWLEKHLEPAYTLSGTRSTSMGLHSYLDMSRLRLLLGGTFGESVVHIRKGETSAPHVRKAVEELLEAGDEESILALRRDQAFLRALRHATRHASEFGHAPDGRDIWAWANACLLRLNGVYGNHPLGDEAMDAFMVIAREVLA